MYVVPSLGAYTVKRRDGTVFGPYCTLDQLVSHLTPRLIHMIGLAFDRATWEYDPLTGRFERTMKAEFAFIVLDEFGDVVDPRVIRELWHARNTPPDPRFRNGPVPRTGKRGSYRYHRHPRTTPTLRAAVAAEQMGLPLRGRSRDVPTAWDDINRADFHDRSWKRHRRTQWKAES